MVRAIALLSGGLDSILAIRVVQEQGVEVEAVHFTSVFSNGAGRPISETSAAKAAGQLGVPLKVIEFTQEMLEMAKNPRHGLGKNLNPCIDCHAAMLRRAGEYMRETGAQFIISGEVLGQRPMSQNWQSLQVVARRSGVEGLALRPLSAQALEPTIPEKEGWVDRGKLLGISGRSRKAQMELAKRFGIREYPNPAGGCLLTDKGFSLRLKDLIDHGEFDLNDVRTLTVGRHYRPDGRTKIIVGRNQAQNELLESLAREGDALLQTVDVQGPLTLVRGEASEENLRMAAEMTARYSQGRDRAVVRVGIRRAGEKAERVIEAEPCDLAKYRRLLFT